MSKFTAEVTIYYEVEYDDNELEEDVTGLTPEQLMDAREELVEATFGDGAGHAMGSEIHIKEHA